MKLTDADLDKLRTKQVANIIRKLGAGKTISAHEQKLLDEERDRTESGASELNFVRNWDDLAQALGVSRKSVQNWRTREDLRSARDFPRPRPDGRHDVNAWRLFMIAHGLNRADENVDDENTPGERRTVRDWKMYREELACTEAERRIARGDSLLLVATDLEVPIGATFVSIQTKLSQFAPRVARFMVMRRDEADAEEKLRDEMDAVLTDLNLASYIDGAAESVARDFPFNDECADLYARVSFAGQDRSLFLELIARCVTESLRRIGASALGATASPGHESAAPAEQQPVEANSAQRSSPPSAGESEARAESDSRELKVATAPRRKRKSVTRRRKA